MLPSGMNGPVGVMLVSSVNSRRAASRRSSPASTMPFGIVHAPASRSLQNGPPGCAMNTSSRPADRRNSSRPALTLGRLERGIALILNCGFADEVREPLRRHTLGGKIASHRHSQASRTMLNRYLTVGAIAFTLGSALAPRLDAQDVDRAMIGKLQDEARAHSHVLESYRTLTEVIGPRLTGSPGFKRAVDWARDRLREWGLSNVTVESWPFGRGWTLEKLTLEMTQPRYFPLEGYPEAWSPSTRGLLAATPIYLGDKTADQIRALGAKLNGAIVLPQPPQEG